MNVSDCRTGLRRRYCGFRDTLRCHWYTGVLCDGIAGSGYGTRDNDVLVDGCTLIVIGFAVTVPQSPEQYLCRLVDTGDKKMH